MYIFLRYYIPTINCFYSPLVPLCFFFYLDPRDQNSQRISGGPNNDKAQSSLQAAFASGSKFFLFILLLYFKMFAQVTDRWCWILITILIVNWTQLVKKLISWYMANCIIFVPLLFKVGAHECSLNFTNSYKIKSLL